MSRYRRNRSDGAESALVMIVLAAIAMPILAIVLLNSKNEDDRDWGIFFAAVSIFVWVPVFFMSMMG